MNEKELQEKYIQIQILQAQLEEYQKELETIAMKQTEIDALKKALSDLEEQKNKKSFSIVGHGIFVESELKNTSDVLVNVGANVLIKKSVKDALKMLEEQQAEIVKINASLVINAQGIQSKMIELQEELQKSVSKQK
jgi:prefoldin alpha subunit